MNNAPEPQPVEFLVSAGVSHRTRQPFVNIILGALDIHVQISPETARKLAHLLYDAAATADADAFLINWFYTCVGIDEKSAVSLLEDFREWRLEKSQKNENHQPSKGQQP